MTACRKQRKDNRRDNDAAASSAGSTFHAVPNDSLITRIEHALVLLAYFIELDGDVHVPMYEKFEAELQELKKTEDTRSRARRFLMAYSQTHSVNAAPDLTIDTGKLSSPSLP